MIRDLRGTCYKDKLQELGLFSLEGRRLQGDMIEVFKNICGIEKRDSKIFFS